ncbi:MAG: cell wall-active antibiotics response protein, partial [Prevotellaceae bacterium]|nr:cell wall-active antibiotics response protein [Prevotellaceae bacterium]
MAAGTLLLLFNIGLLPAEYRPVIFSWQMLLVAVGCTLLPSRRKFGLGILLILVGDLLLLPKLGLSGLLKDNIWPVAVILVGLFIVTHALWNRRRIDRFGRRCAQHLHELKKEHQDVLNEHRRREKNSGSQRTESGYMEVNTVFGSGAYEKFNRETFKGGEINNVFGGTEIDFSDTQLEEGVHTLEVNSVFGGVV